MWGGTPVTSYHCRTVTPRRQALRMPSKPLLSPAIIGTRQPNRICSSPPSPSKTVGDADRNPVAYQTSHFYGTL